MITASSRLKLLGLSVHFSAPVDMLFWQNISYIFMALLYFATRGKI